MTIVASDTFTEGSDTALASHTPDVGTSWATEAAEWTVVSATGELIHTTTTTRFAREGTNLGSDQMDVTASVKMSTAVNNRFLGVAGRMSGADFNNGYEASLIIQSGTIRARLVKEVAGTRTTLQTTVASYTPNVVLTLTLEIRTVAKKVLVNGVEVISNADDSLSGLTYAGVIGSVNTQAGCVMTSWQSATVDSAVFYENWHGIEQGMKPQTASGMGGVLVT